MSYRAAVEVHSSVKEMLGRNKNIVMTALNNDGGQFGILIGAIQPDDVEVPKELDGVPIKVIKMDRPSAEEYQIH